MHLIRKTINYYLPYYKQISIILKVIANLTGFQNTRANSSITVNTIVGGLSTRRMPAVFLQVGLVDRVGTAVNDSNVVGFAIEGDISGVIKSFTVVWGLVGDVYIVGEGIGGAVNDGSQRLVEQQPVPKHF